MDKRVSVTVIAPDGETSPYIPKLLECLGSNSIRYQRWVWLQGASQIDSIKCPDISYQRKGCDLPLLSYLKWMSWVFLRTLRNTDRTLYFCSRFDAAFPVALASLFRRRKYIFANRDNILLSYRWPRGFCKIVELLQKWVASRALIHLLPDSCQFEGPNHNLAAIPNCPSQALLKKAGEIARVQKYHRPEWPFVIYINGWLSTTRGLGMICEALERLRHLDLELVVAGRALDVDHPLRKLANVKHLGKLSPEESLAQYYRSHLVPVLYDPNIPVNRVACPNKLYDCISTATPFITNIEMLTARPFVDDGACIAVPYGNGESLATAIESLATQRGDWESVRRAQLAIDLEPWDVQMKDLIRTALCAD